MTKILDVNVVPVEDQDPNTLIFKKFQDIPDWWIQRLRDQTENRGGKEMKRVASIPVAVVEHWAKQGFHLKEHTAQEIVARLRNEDLGYFITGTP